MERGEGKGARGGKKGGTHYSFLPSVTPPPADEAPLVCQRLRSGVVGDVETQQPEWKMSEGTNVRFLVSPQTGAESPSAASSRAQRLISCFLCSFSLNGK